MLGGVKGSTTSRKSSHQCPDPRSSLPTPRSLLSGTPGQQQWKVTADFPSNTVPTFAKTEETHSRLESDFNFLLFFFFFLAAGGCFIYLFLMPSPAFELHLPEKEHPNGMPICRYPKKGGSALGTAASSPITHVSKSKVPFSSILPSLKPSNPEVQLGHRTNSSNIAWVFFPAPR